MLCVPISSGGFGDWSTRGCRSIAQYGQTMCACNHLTHFAVLLVGFLYFFCHYCISLKARKFLCSCVTTCVDRAWRDHCFPEPFSWFSQETALESLKITSARSVLMKCLKKDSKKRKYTASFAASLQPQSTVQLFMPVSGVEKPSFSQFLSASGCHFASKSLSWPAMPVSKKKQEFEQRKRIKLFDDFWVRAYRFDFARGAGLEHGQYNQSIFSLLIFGILVERLSFYSVFIFCYDFVTVFLSSSMQRLKYAVTDFLISPAKKVMLRQSRPSRVKQHFGRFFVHISTSRAKLKIFALSATPTTPAHTNQSGRCK